MTDLYLVSILLTVYLFGVGSCFQWAYQRGYNDAKLSNGGLKK